MADLKGVDISYAQGTVDFDKLCKAVDFVIIRSSYGVGYYDSFFDRNRSEAKRTNLIRGIYHYAYPQYNSATNEANYFTSKVGNLMQNEFLVLDLEEKCDNPVQWAKEFLDRLSQLYPSHKAFFYSYLSYIQSHDFTPLNSYPFWLAWYTFNTSSTLPNLGLNEIIWQYSDKGNVDGVSGLLDLDIVKVDRNKFLSYINTNKMTDEQSHTLGTFLWNEMTGDVNNSNAQNYATSMFNGEYSKSNDFDAGLKAAIAWINSTPEYARNRSIFDLATTHTHSDDEVNGLINTNKTQLDQISLAQKRISDLENNLASVSQKLADLQNSKPVEKPVKPIPVITPVQPVIVKPNYESLFQKILNWLFKKS